MKLALFLLFLLTALVGSAHAQNAKTAESKTLLERARAGDSSALSEMEKNRDIEDLKVLLHDRHYNGKASVRVLLARLDDPEILQDYACLSLRAHNGWTIDVLIRNDFDLIGGYFTVKVYRELLDSDQRFQPTNDKFLKRLPPGDDDLPPMLPSIAVLYKLPVLLPEANLPLDKKMAYELPADKDFVRRNKWKSWIDSHTDDIKNLEPKGETVRFDSAACSKKREKS